MKRRTQIAFGVGLALIVGMGAVTAWQWNNISAALSFVRFSQQELEDKLNENDQKIKDAVDAVPEVNIRDITQEEKDALRDGTLTQEELIESLIKPEQEKESPKQEPEKPVVPDTPKPEKPPEQKPEQPPALSEQEQASQQNDYAKKLAAIIAEVYVLREQFLIKLDEMQKQAIADYVAIPEKERSATRITKLVSNYLAKGLDLEKECDAQIGAIIVRMETLISENNGDMSIAQTVYDTYVEEKSLKKAWYMAELKKRGMI